MLWDYHLLPALRNGHCGPPSCCSSPSSARDCYPQGPQQPRLPQSPLSFPEVSLTTPPNLRPESGSLSAAYTHPGVTMNSWQGLAGTGLPYPLLAWHTLSLLGRALQKQARPCPTTGRAIFVCSHMVTTGPQGHLPLAHSSLEAEAVSYFSRQRPLDPSLAH